MDSEIPTVQEIMAQRGCKERQAFHVLALLKAGKSAPRMVRGFPSYGDEEETTVAVEAYLRYEVDLAQGARKITEEGVSVRTFQRRVAAYVRKRDARSIETAQK